MFALAVPPTSHLFNWPILFGGNGIFGVNKVVLIFWLATVVTIGFFLLAKKELVPTGVQNLAEITVEFIENGIILQTMGPEGLPFTGFLLTIFCLTLVINLLGLLPFIQMPANSRIALPLFMAVVVWLVYNFMGVAKNGVGGYLKHILLPPGVPMALKPLMAIINFISDIFVRPFALMVRLFANMFAGHLIIVSFGALCVALFNATKIGALLPYPLLVALTGFELLVAFLQAYIFTILAAVFTSLAMGHGGDHGEEHH